MAYLVMKYAKNDSLYPRDPEKRSLVEHRLYFDMGTLYENIILYHVRKDIFKIYNKLVFKFLFYLVEFLIAHL